MSNKIDLVIDQGATFSHTFRVVDENGIAVDLTAATGSAQMRKHYLSTSSYSFTVTPANGSVTIAMANTATFRVPAGRYVYDLKVTNANTVTRLYEGVVTVTPCVTR